MEQLNLDFSARTRKNDPDTSKKAAAKVDLGKVRKQVLLEISRFGQYGASTIELASSLGRQRDSVSPHIKPLIELGFIEKAPFVRKNPVTNNDCQVYVVTTKFLSSRFFDGRVYLTGKTRQPTLPAVRARSSIVCPHCNGEVRLI